MHGQQPRYSLVVATLGRTAELALFLDSLLDQRLDHSLFEVLVVDQNEDALIDGLLASYSNRLSIKHIRSGQKGLSLNRNLGISQARGQFIAVPDDDCTYYPDTLASVEQARQEWPEADMLIGKVFNRASGTFVFKKTPADPLQINAWSFYSVVSSITMFFRNSELRFDEQFGVGAPYASNEDGVMILRHIRAGKKVVYVPGVACDHPPYDAETMPVDKLYRYGIGFGAMCRKFWSLPLCWLLLKVVGFQVLMLLKELLCFRRANAQRRWAALKGRCTGFIRYGRV